MGKSNRNRKKRSYTPKKVQITKASLRSNTRALKQQIQVEINKGLQKNYSEQISSIETLNVTNESVTKITNGRRIEYATDSSDSFNISITYDTSSNTLIHQNQGKNVNRNLNHGQRNTTVTETQPTCEKPSPPKFKLNRERPSTSTSETQPNYEKATSKKIKLNRERANINVTKTQLNCEKISPAKIKLDREIAIVKAQPFHEKISPIKIKPNCKKPNATITKSNDRTLSDWYKTIDCVSDANNDDVVLINDDSDVIFVGSNNNSVATNKEQDIDDSVILIEDDSVMEVERRLSPRHIPVWEPNIQAQMGIKAIATSTPMPARNMYNFSVPYLFNMEQDQRQKAVRPINVSNNLNTLGSNFLNVGTIRMQGLRPIFIDGSNVAMGHSNGKFFSVKGLKICIDYFKLRGHEVTAVVPRFRQNRSQNSDSALLNQMESDGTVIFTPSRRINGKNIVPYDDRYIVLLAHVHKGIIVSSDNYRDVLQEDPSVLDTLENRILNPTWLKDMIMFPSDPLGRHGPKLDVFLRFP